MEKIGKCLAEKGGMMWHGLAKTLQNTQAELSECRAIKKKQKTPPVALIIFLSNCWFP